eukprot:CAMPEP_0119546596 /NCGR_PEP_ID=MMETSP1352-20130426/946_1 /TAXON_ID=265584 /ORGANISM="Stauroneis constricta, Strain CCMP1120" /LENGTH=663 /DNA_ID=CAMNT_0007591315 /DNA_START=83 /DNA_END=2074 /DNA_ORIENTATION=-
MNQFQHQAFQREQQPHAATWLSPDADGHSSDGSSSEGCCLGGDAQQQAACLWAPLPFSNSSSSSSNAFQKTVSSTNAYAAHAQQPFFHVNMNPPSFAIADGGTGNVSVNVHQINSNTTSTSNGAAGRSSVASSFPIEVSTMLLDPIPLNINNNRNTNSGNNYDIDIDFELKHTKRVSSPVHSSSVATTSAEEEKKEQHQHQQQTDHDFYHGNNYVPPTQVDEYQNLLAKALQSMSLKERERAYEDLHGVLPTPSEGDDSTTKQLQQMQSCIDSMKSKMAYNTARQQNEAYVTNPQFMYKFLCAEEYDTEEAAKRYIRHYDAKQKFWGASLLTCDITLAEVSSIVKETMSRCASMQLLPFRDTSGRLITFSWERYHRMYYPSKEDGANVCQVMAQLFWYFMMSLTEDEASYMKGIVHVAYGLDMPQTSLTEDDRTMWWNSCIIANSVPLRVGGLHYCFNDPKFRPILSLLAMGFPKKIKSRIRVHCGAHQEVHYSLMSYGLPIEHFPVTATGDWKKTYASKWYEYRTHKDSNNKYKDAVYAPPRNAILLGRGKSRQKHPGNLEFHDYVSQYYDEYNAAKRLVKNAVAQKIVNSISCQVYIKDDNDMWIPVPKNNKLLLEKVCHSLRRNRRIEKKLKVDEGKQTTTKAKVTTFDTNHKRLKMAVA